MISRGEIWWADLAEPIGSAPGYRRPVLVVQADSFNRSRIDTVIVAALTSNLEIANAPGNVLLMRSESGLSRDSVVMISQILAIDRANLTEKSGSLPRAIMRRIESGLRLVLGLAAS